MKTYKIHIIRHGLSEGNLQGRYIGITDSPLSERGRVQLRELAEKGTYPFAGRYYTSPLSRCYDTLKEIYPECEPVVIKALCECNLGQFENKTAEELAGDPAFAAWLSGTGNAAPPDGESNAAFAQRVCGAFELIVRELMSVGMTSAVICTHGGVIMSILSAFGIPERQPQDWLTPNGLGYTLRITPGFWMRMNKLEVFQLEGAGNVGTADDDEE